MTPALKLVPLPVDPGPEDLAKRAGRQRISNAAAEKFWSQVVKRDTGCWEWLGTRVPGKYGTYCGVRAHRYAYEAMVGPIPSGKDLDHLCRNTLCVNPKHLEPVTKSENSRRYWASIKRGDSFRPGRSEMAPTARQTEILRGIKEFVETNGYSPSIRELCTMFDVASTNGMNDALRALEARGLIERGRQTARSLRVTDKGFAALSSAEVAP